jgi:2-oxoisovalerate dehydrogenase E1 component beta subunit
MGGGDPVGALEPVDTKHTKDGKEHVLGVERNDTMSKELTYLEAIREALLEEMERDARVFVLGEDVGPYGGAFGVTQGLYDKFGEMRVIDTPISESAIIGISIGAALRGYRPIAEMQFADFISCGFDQIVNQAATLRYRYGGRQDVPIVIRAPSGGNVGGGLYHSQNPEAWFIHRPGLKVVAPSTPYDAKGLLKAAIRDNNPVVYFEHKYLYRRGKGPVPEGDDIVPIGVAATRREGDDITLLTYAAMVTPSLEAAERLSKEGVDVEVIDLRTLLPFDKAAIFRSLEKTNRVLIVHEDVKTLGIGAELSAVIMEERFEHLDAPVLRVTYADTPCPFSQILEQANLPDADKIEAALKRLAAY